MQILPSTKFRGEFQIDQQLSKALGNVKAFCVNVQKKCLSVIEELWRKIAKS
jgi:hypothetical protein